MSNRNRFMFYFKILTKIKYLALKKQYFNIFFGLESSTYYFFCFKNINFYCNLKNEYSIIKRVMNIY